MFAEAFYGHSADARRGIDSTYIKPCYLPKMDIKCYREGRNLTPVIGETDINEKPEYPTPDEEPDDPIEVTKDAIEECKQAILHYDGSVIEGEKGVMPGVQYGQPIYREIWCESDTTQPDLLKFQSELEVVDDVVGWNVKVVTSKGMPSVPFMYENCKRFQELANKYPHIEKIVILYFGDSDKAGHNIRKCIENAIRWYCSGHSPDLHVTIPIEIRHIAITKEQVKKYKLTGAQLEAFLTTEKRLTQLKEILLQALKDGWNEDIYYDNCPPEEYDYEANGEEPPEEIDIDNELYGDTDITIREKMIQMATEAFKPGWENE